MVAGKIIAGNLVKLACQRHLDDLASSRKKEYPYKFDPSKANRPCRFIEQLPHVRGKWARAKRGESNKIKLEPWQVYLVCSIFGWVEKSTGLRKYFEAYVCVARKNAKSTLAAGIGLYMLCADGEYGAEVYSGATTERQAMEVFRTAWSMAKDTPELRKFFGVEVAAKSLYIEEDGSRMAPVVGDPGDGMSPSCAVIDEFHEHLTPMLHDTMQTGMGAREQPLVLDITTAGSLIEGPCHTLEKEGIQVLEGRMANDALFVLIFRKDPEDDWKSELARLKANPNNGVSVFPAFLEKAQRDAIQSSHKQNIYRTKHGNEWVNAATGWMNMAAWDKCKDASLNVEEFRRHECFQGVDLAGKIDLASRIKVFKEIRDGLVHYFVFGRHYVPMDRAMDGEHSHYDRWVKDGNLIAMAGPEIKLSGIQKEIEAEIPLFDMKCIAFDPWSALQMQQDLAVLLSEDIVLSIPQTVQYLSDPMKEVEAAVLAGRFHHDGDPVLTWAVSNVIAREDNNSNVFPRKEKKGKGNIDPVSALINAMRIAYSAPPAEERYTEVGIGVV